MFLAFTTLNSDCTAACFAASWTTSSLQYEFTAICSLLSMSSFVKDFLTMNYTRLLKSSSVCSTPCFISKRCRDVDCVLTGSAIRLKTLGLDDSVV